MTDERNSRPAGEAKDGREGSGGFGGDGEGLPLAIFEGSGEAAEDDAAVAFDGKAVSPVGGRMVPGGTRNRHLSMQREMPAAVKMLMVSVATRSAMRPSTKRPVSSIKAETPPRWWSNYRHGLGFGRREHLEQREE